MEIEVPYLVHQLYENPNQLVRKEAETRLYDIMAIAPDTAIQSIIPSIMDNSKPLHLRQLFLILLNQQIQRYCQWNTILPSSKQLAIELAFNGCYTAETNIRIPSMVLLSTILSRSNNNERTFVLNMLIYSLNQQSDQQTKFYFTLKCLVIIVDSELDSGLLIQLVEICYPKILEHFSSVARTVGYHSNKELQYLSKLMRISMQKLENIQLQEGTIYNSNIGILSSVITTWASLSTSYLNLFSSATTINSIISEPGGLIETVDSIIIGIQSFPQYFKSKFDVIISSSLSCLCLLKETYLSNTLTSISGGYIGDNVLSAGYSSDGDRIDVEILVINLLQLLNILYTSCQDVAISPDMLLTGNLVKLMDILIDYMQMTASMVDCWNNDGNLYVSSEEDIDNSNDFSLRFIGAKLLKSTCSYFKSPVFSYLFNAISQQWQQLQVQAGRFNENARILQIEKLLWSLGFIGKSYMKYYLRLNNASTANVAAASQHRIDEASVIVADIPFKSINYLLESMCQCLLTPQTPAILRSRLIWLINIFALLSDSSTIISSITCGKDILDSNMDNLSSKLLALRSITGILFKLKTNANSATAKLVLSTLNMESVITSCLQLTPHLTESTIHFLIEALTLFLEISPVINDVKILNDMGIFISQAISKYYYDQFILNNLVLLVGNITNINHGIHAIDATIIPYFKSVLSGQYTSLPSTFCSFTTRIISKIGTSVLCSSATKCSLFNILLAYIQKIPTSHQSEVYNTIKTIISDKKCESLRSILLNAPDTSPADSALATLLNTICATLSDITLQTLEHHEDDAYSDTEIENESPSGILDCCYPIAGIVCHIFCTLSDLVIDKSLIIQLFVSLFKCIEATTESPARNSMMMCIIHIFARSPAELMSVINISQQVYFADGKFNIFYNLLQRWHELHPSLNSRYNRVISTIGLLNLLQIMDSQISNMQLSIKQSLVKMVLDTIPLLYDINYTNNSISIPIEETMGSSDKDNMLKNIFKNLGSDDYDDDDQEVDDDDDDDSYGSNDEAAIDEANPAANGSAATEIFLSDLLDVYSSSNSIITDDIVFSNTSEDNLYGTDVASILVAYLKSQNLDELISSYEHKLLLLFLQQL